MRKLATIAVGIILGPLALHGHVAHAQSTIDQYLLMSVCTDSSNHIINGVTPLSASGCTNERQILEGEYPPYHLNTFYTSTPPPITSTFDTVPTTKSGTTLSISYFHRSSHQAANEVSIHHYDGNYGFTMASWSPSGLYAENGPASVCAATPSLRFNDAWVLGSYNVLALNATSWQIFHGGIELDSYPAGSLPCPSGDQAGFSTWTTRSFTFGSATTSTQHTLTTVISDHYSHADTTTSSPGDAMQMERVYLTKELGLSRWEAWKRSDFTENGQTAEQMSLALRTDGTCDLPYGRFQNITSGFGRGDVISSPHDGYSQVYTISGITDPATGGNYTWYMTGCHDYTNLVIENSPFDPTAGFDIDPIFWNP